MTAAEHYVLVGVARARERWSSDLARWSTSGAAPLEFVKCLTPDEARAVLGSGRRASALLLDARGPGVDRDLIAAAAEIGVPTIIVSDRTVHHDWDALGCATVIDHRLELQPLLDTLARHTVPVDRTRRPGRAAIRRESPAPRSRIVAVLGSGGGGSSTVAMADRPGDGAVRHRRGADRAGRRCSAGQPRHVPPHRRRHSRTSRTGRRPPLGPARPRRGPTTDVRGPAAWLLGAARASACRRLGDVAPPFRGRIAGRARREPSTRWCWTSIPTSTARWRQGPRTSRIVTRSPSPRSSVPTWSWSSDDLTCMDCMHSPRSSRTCSTAEFRRTGCSPWSPNRLAPPRAGRRSPPPSRRWRTPAPIATASRWVRSSTSAVSAAWTTSMIESVRSPRRCVSRCGDSSVPARSGGTSPAARGPAPRATGRSGGERSPPRRFGPHGGARSEVA